MPSFKNNGFNKAKKITRTVRVIFLLIQRLDHNSLME